MITELWLNGQSLTYNEIKNWSIEDYVWHNPKADDVVDKIIKRWSFLINRIKKEIVRENIVKNNQIGNDIIKYENYFINQIIHISKAMNMDFIRNVIVDCYGYNWYNLYNFYIENRHFVYEENNNEKNIVINIIHYFDKFLNQIYSILSWRIREIIYNFISY